MAKERESKTRTQRINDKYVEAIRHSSSERVSICTDCGNPFEQVWRPEQEQYTTFKRCGICRAMIARGGINSVLPYVPHWGQQLIHDSTARFKVINAGNRWGKDRCSVMDAIKRFGDMLNEDRSADLVPGVLFWQIAPSFRLARQSWREILSYLPREWVLNYSEADRTIKTINGGLIEIHSADDPESLVSVGLDMVLITEAARIRDLELVIANLEARLSSPGRGPGGKGGIMIINSSPIGRNYFYTLWKFGQKNLPDYDPAWESWTFTTWDNPYMAKRGEVVQKNGRTYKENLERRMSDRLYRQNYLAEFLAEANSMFPKADDCAVRFKDLTEEQREEWGKVDPYETYRIGYDPARSVDNSGVIVRNSKGKVAKVDLMRGMDWDAQWDRIEFYSKYYNNAVVGFGKTGLGETIESQLIKRGLAVDPINEQGRNKEMLVEKLAVLIEQKRISYPDDELLLNELKDYEYKTVSGRTVYSNASSDGHDDLVMAMCFAFADFDVIEETLPFTGLIGGVKQNHRRY